jgi:hypothetical protein
LDEAELGRVSVQGLSALLPVERLCDLAEYCWDRGETTGDARYCSLWRAFIEIVEFFEEYDAMEMWTFDSLDGVLKRDLGAVLQADTAEAGALLARGVREEVLAILRDDRLAGGSAPRQGDPEQA